MKAEDCFEIGYITKTRGLKGEVQVYLEVDNPEAYIKMESVFLEINKKLVPFFIEGLQIRKNLAYIFFEDVESIEEASTLVKKKVYLALEQKPGEDVPAGIQLYKGYQVTDKEKGEIGIIAEILEMPQQFIAVIHKEGKEILLPLNDAFIEKADHKTRSLTVALPEGLLDIYLD